MHWSKTRHVAYEECPRKFFYSAIAATHNPEIRSLEEDDTPPLVRHNLVRAAIDNIVGLEKWENKYLIELLTRIRVELEKFVENPDDQNAQYSIIEACLESFCVHALADIRGGKILHRASSDPVEFVYDNLTIIALPELVVELAGNPTVITFKTGSSDFRSQAESDLRAGGLTCWARAILKLVERRIEVKELFLRNDCDEFSVTLSDDDVRGFIRRAKEMRDRYAGSAKIRDFPAQPGECCRFCPYKGICPEWKEYAEKDYGLAALANRIAVPAEAKDEEPPETKQFYLAHASEDKDGFVRPFARAMEAAGLSYWLDEAEIRWGNSLTRKINEGLRTSDYVICFLSPAFIGPGWSEAELGASLSHQFSNGKDRVLPLLLTDLDSILGEYPILKDIRCESWSDGIDSLIKELKVRAETH